MTPQILECTTPDTGVVPVVLDSPHSGEISPGDFEHNVSPQRLRLTVDAYVDELFARGPQFGATLLRALFPRTYIDPNRGLDDVDEDMLDEPWPDAINPGIKVTQGIGLVARRDLYGAIYRRKLRVDEVRARIDDYYQPYHRALAGAIERHWQTFGAVWHINCHSMRSLAKLRTQGLTQRADICVGDRDGQTADSAFRELVVETLRGLGYQVAVNDPYKGVELVSRYSDPAKRRHSIQIEIARSLYMNENLVERNTGFAQVQADMSRLVEVVCEYAREETFDNLAIGRAAE